MEHWGPLVWNCEFRLLCLTSAAASAVSLIVVGLLTGL